MPFFFCVRTNYKATYSVQRKPRVTREDARKTINDDFFSAPSSACFARSSPFLVIVRSSFVGCPSSLYTYSDLREVMKSHTWYRVVSEKFGEDYLWNLSDLIGILILWQTFKTMSCITYLDTPTKTQQLAHMIQTPTDSSSCKVLTFFY